MKKSRRTLIGAFVAAAVLIPATAAFATHFTDIDGSVHKDNIEWLETTGITTGCVPGQPLYCPQDNVTRGQMATFMRRLAGQDPSVAPMVMAAHALEADMADSAAGVEYLTPFYAATDSDGQGGPAAGVTVYEDANIKLDFLCDDGSDNADGGLDLDIVLLLTAVADDLVIATSDDDDPDFDSGETSNFFDNTGNTDNAPTSDNDIDEGFVFNPATGDYYSIDGETLMLFFDGQTCHTAFSMTHYNTDDAVVLP